MSLCKMKSTLLLLTLITLVLSDQLVRVVLVVGSGEEELNLNHPIGQLTLAGMKQAYDNGKNLKAMYESDGLIVDNLISGDLPTSQVHAESLARPSNMMTASTLLAGMFPPTPDQIFEVGLNWQPFPVYQSQVLSAVYQECEARKQIYAMESLNSLEISEFIMDNMESIAALYSVLGYEGTDIQMMDRLYQIYLYETDNNMTHNTAIEENIDLITLAHDIIWRNKIYWNQDNIKVFAGTVLNKISSVFTESYKFKEELTPRLYIYSSDDSTLTWVMTALGLYDGVRPQLNTVLHFELWNNDAQPPDNYYVKLRLTVNSDNITTTELVLPFCEQECDITSFLSNMKQLAITREEFEILCAPRNSLLDNLTQKTMVVVVSVGAAMTLFGIAYFITRRRQGSSLISTPTNRWNKLLDEHDDY